MSASGGVMRVLSTESDQQPLLLSDVRDSTVRIPAAQPLPEGDRGHLYFVRSV
jgi:hypothetical protein